MRFKIILLVILCISISSCKKASETKVLYLGHTLPQTHPVHKGIIEFKKALELKSNGTLKVKVFPDGQLGSERETLELLQIGSVAATKVSAATLSNFVPEYNVLGIPYLFRNKEHQFSVLEGKVGKTILEKGSKFWLRGLCYYDAGSRSFYTSKKAIRTPEDLKGLKIRVQNNQMAINMVNSMGGAATPLAYGELYAAIQQGVVDGAENNPPSFVSSNHYEISKYYTLDQHSSVPDVLLIGTKFWNKLSEQEKVWVQAAADESAQAQKVFWRESVEASMKIVKDWGVEVIIPEKSLFAEESKNVVIEFVKKFPEMADIVNQIKK
ncbi:C4-dicarboxylate ABC transporter substrate-binding protein [Polaribacter reichenbachii]|uniref:C4-dicarboxylate ABC transporter substrate-binding protein n=1 Tax=Polaribacter reichenbachii TaxID=996801 RepID=A0A1B8U617_9FLAO|nr:TRAP transporter substrate-binding protein [Polaribacter reichenbachii]APZ45947.1 C4-dicarboxylate ABC transporter substrate-binding protein [Polaribacter reichenbachii]AUC19809.1 C4-dicarboxylate ABC transporter substrate-binding protein [Polaribacter reichenbachii]OBY67336.1 C4-dicarboxylate ABC transporter substrate-binding protein [Polaribacter reichenbachii]